MNKIKFLDGTKLKIIALIFMICDHIYEMFNHVGAPIWLTMIGRVVFPIFLFLSAESFHYTKDKYKYIRRLFLASILMGTGSILLTKIMPNDNVVLMNNAFSTFFSAALCMLIWDKILDIKNNKNYKNLLSILGIIVFMIILVIPYISVFALVSSPMMETKPNLMMALANISIIIPNILNAEGGVLMVILGLFFYIFREKRIIQYIGYAAFSMFLYYLNPSSIQWFMIFALPFMIFYNGEKGKGLKWLFYIIYPAHIYILYIISTLLY